MMLVKMKNDPTGLNNDILIRFFHILFRFYTFLDTIL